VSAEALGSLDTLLGPERRLERAVEITRTRLFDDGRTVEAAIRPGAASITRFDLDAALWQAARGKGVECRDACEVGAITRDPGRFTVRTDVATFNGQAIIDAAGRWSRLRENKVLPGPKWIGLKCHYSSSEFQVPRSGDKVSSENGSGSVDLYFFERGYCGVQPIAPGVVNACAMVRSDRAKTLEEVFALHPALEKRSRAWKALFEPISTAPLVFKDPQPVRYVSHEPVVCVGDAAAFIDPFVGDGISLALRTGVAAGEALGRAPFDRESLRQRCKTYAQRYEKEFVPILRSAARVRRLIDTPSALRSLAFGAMRVPVIADYVIRKTRQTH
jgi:flavin-dependent dehydrogenase